MANFMGSVAYCLCVVMVAHVLFSNQADARVMAPMYAPEAAPVGAPMDSPTYAPQNAPVYAPEMAPEMAPMYAPEMAPEMTPMYAPEMAPEMAPMYTPEMAPAPAPEMSPVLAPLPSGPSAGLVPGPNQAAASAAAPTTIVSRPAAIVLTGFIALYFL